MTANANIASINLLPASRRMARRRRQERARCVAAGVAFTALAGIGTLILRATVDPGDGDYAGRLNSAQEELDRTEKLASAAQSDLQSAQSLLKATRSIAEQPDWSLLMSILAARAGEDVSLKACAVRPRDVEPPAVSGPKKPGTPAPKPADPVVLVTLSGRGRTQADVSRFVLRLESTRLFGRVTLLDTGREVFDRGEAIGFRIECSLDGPGQVAAVNTPAPVRGAKTARVE